LHSDSFGEPAEDRGEEGDRLLRPALLPTQAGEAHRAAQFPGLRVLPARDVDALLQGRLGLAHRLGASEQGLAPEPIELGFKRRRSPHLFDRLQPGGDRCQRRFRFADRQLRIGLQRQQNMLERPSTVAVHPLAVLGQPLLAFAGDAERPSAHAKGIRLPVGDALLLADPQSPFGTVGGRRWLVAKDVNEGDPTQRLGEGHRVPKRLGASYRCPQLLKGPIRAG
jgi:hypothetical protein